MTQKMFLIYLMLYVLLTACTDLPSAQTQPVVDVTPSTLPMPTQSLTVTEASEQEAVLVEETATPEISETQTETRVTPLPDYYANEPAVWQNWPVIPILSKEMIDVYEEGKRQGRDPHAFSVFGDCQSLPETYMGIYDSEGFTFPVDDQKLQETIDWFSGSFSRSGPTLKNGTTVAAILWEGWIETDTKECEYGDTPLECEIRLHNPSIVFINLGTHWEVRNQMYLRKIVDELISRGIVPIISTKADTREVEAYINEEMVQVAYDYGVPVWNFWLAVQNLENQGMKPGDTMYLTDEGLETQRFTSLQALDAVWRELNSTH